MRFTSIIFLVLGFLLVSTLATASHILGGEFQLSPTSIAGRYQLAMVVFYDAKLTNFTNKDPYVDDVLIYRKRDNQLMKSNRLTLVSEREISYPNQGCATSIIQTLAVTYSNTIDLNPNEYNDPDGYYIVWERCCRSASVSNLTDPGSTGLVFYLEFPALSIRTSSPVFNSPNGDYICRGLPYSMNVGATDADGDELRYSLATPTRGNTTLAEPRGNSLPKAGYPLVELAPGISNQNLIPGNPSVRIDPSSGEVTVVASQLGLYVFTVQCEEFRNGKRIGLTRRDYQSIVVECQPQMVPTPTILYNQQPVPNIQQCDNSAVTLEVADAGDYAYQWQFNTQNIPGATGTTYQASENGAYTVRRSLTTPGNCSQPSQSPIVYLVQGRTPDATIRKTDAAICAGKKIDLVAERNDDFSYAWQKNGVLLPEKSSILAVTEAGSYGLEIKNRSNGCIASDTVRVFSESVTLKLNPQVSFPRGGSVVLKPEAVSAFPPLQYQWYPPDGLNDSKVANPVASPNQTASYKLVVTTPGGCQDSAAIEVVVIECTPVMPPKPEILYKGVAGVPVVYACGNESVTLGLVANPEYSYQWQRNGIDVPGAVNATIMARDTGKYTLILGFRETDPCKSFIVSDPITLIQVANPEATIVADANRICPGGTVQLTSVPAPDIVYQWTGPVNGVQGTGSSIAPSLGGTYFLLATNTVTGCSSTDSVSLMEEKIKLTLAPEARIQNGKSIQISPIVESNAETISYSWSPTAGLSAPRDSIVLASPTTTTTYVLVLTTQAGCTVSDSISIVVFDQLYVPDAFSPNGDGINDVLVIQNAMELVVSIRIYDRWGEVVFGEEGYEVAWNGMLDTKRVPVGTYAYVIVTDKSIYKGAIMVLY